MINVTDNDMRLLAAYIAERLVYARRKAAMLGSELAQRSGVHPSMISRYEHGSHLPTLPALCALAQALERQIDFFLPTTLEAARRASNYPEKG